VRLEDFFWNPDILQYDPSYTLQFGPSPARVQDYRESKKKYLNDLIMFRLITPLKRNAPSKNLSFKIIDLEFVYPNLLFKVFYNDYWDFYKHITGHSNHADRAASSAFSVFGL